MRRLIKKLISIICTGISLAGIAHKQGCRCNYLCRFTKRTEIGTDCHFNGTRIYGEGAVKIGDHFHSGKNIKMLTTFHDYDHGERLPYDDKTYSRDIVIKRNVWLGDDVLILGGVTIGEGAVIQAGSVVCRDVPDLAVAGGHPAVPFKYRDIDHYNRVLQETSEE